jgi:hypothetical protein
MSKNNDKESLDNTETLDEKNNAVYDYNLYESLFDNSFFTGDSRTVALSTIKKYLYITRPNKEKRLLAQAYRDSDPEISKNENNDITKLTTRNYISNINYEIKILTGYATDTKINNVRESLFILVDLFEWFEYVYKNPNLTGINRKLEILQNKLKHPETIKLIMSLRNTTNIFKDKRAIMFKERYTYFIGMLRLSYFNTIQTLTNFYNECVAYEDYVNTPIDKKDNTSETKLVIQFICKSLASFSGNYRLYTIIDVYQKAVLNQKDNFKLTLVNDEDYILSRKEIITRNDNNFNEMNLIIVTIYSLYTQGNRHNDILEELKKLESLEIKINTDYMNTHGKLLPNMKLHVDVNQIQVDKLDLQYFKNNLKFIEKDNNDVLIKLRLLRTFQEGEGEEEILDIPIPKTKKR